MPNNQVSNALIFLFGANIIISVAVVMVAIVLFLRLSDYFLNHKNFQVLSTHPIDYYLNSVEIIINDVSSNILSKKFLIADTPSKTGRVYITPEAFDEVKTEIYNEVITALSPITRNGLELLYSIDYVNIYIYKRIESVCIDYAVGNNAEATFNGGNV